MNAQHTPGPQVGIALALHIGQHVRHHDYNGKRVTGKVRALAIEEQALMATISLDRPIVIPASEGQRQIDIYRQHVPAHELAPFDDRDELIEELLAAAAAASLCIVEMPPTQARAEVAQMLCDAIARANGGEG